MDEHLAIMASFQRVRIITMEYRVIVDGHAFAVREFAESEKLNEKYTVMGLDAKIEDDGVVFILIVDANE